jgi:hypothetical protein
MERSGFYPNLLLVGPDGPARRRLAQILADCRQPVHERTAGGVDPMPRHGTIVLRDVAGLDLRQQRLLLRWLTECMDVVQVVTVAAESLFPSVQRGAFLDALFYRLNVVTLMIDEEGETAAAATESGRAVRWSS